ncbi:MAG: hypothetical protein ACSLE8_22765, partial [Rhodococcus sp. (in: high G+C Gram-positive bacteria)]
RGRRFVTRGTALSMRCLVTRTTTDASRSFESKSGTPGIFRAFLFAIIKRLLGELDEMKPEKEGLWLSIRSN